MRVMRAVFTAVLALAVSQTSSPAMASTAMVDNAPTPGCGPRTGNSSISELLAEGDDSVTAGASSTGSKCSPPTAVPTAGGGRAAGPVRQCAILSAALPGVAEGIPGGDPFAPTLSGGEVQARRVSGGQLVVGGIYLRYCSADAGAWVLVSTFTFQGGADPTPAPMPAPVPEDVARLALAQIALPRPRPLTAPPRDKTGLVGIATWLWVDPGQWRPLSATARVPGLEVTAVVTPVRTRWDMGEGRDRRAVICDGPGKPYDPRVKDSLQKTVPVGFR